jgi:PKD repeat protein
MQGLQPSVFLAMALAFAAVTAEAQLSGLVAEDLSFPNTPALLRDDVSIDVLSSAPHSFEPLRIHAPGASYVRLHFARFSLPAGVVVEVGNEAGTETYRYANGKLDALTVDRARGDDGVNRFSAMSVTGDTAVVRVRGRLDRFVPGRHGVLIDSWLEGPGQHSSGAGTAKDAAGGDSHIETTCGGNERYDAKCYSSSHPAEYDRAIPVALLITSTGEECTAWRVGADNRMFTAEHCISGQGDLDGSEIWFHYRAESCGSSAATEPVKVTGGQLLAKDGTLDYALFTVNDFASIAYLGHLGLDLRSGVPGESIFIPQHGLGKPKQIALESDMNSSGLCEIDDNDYDGYATGSDLGYFCDTTTSSSGAPVIARVTGKVIALHHLGGCFNSGSKVSLIWPEVSAHFGGLVPEGDNEDGWDAGNQPPEAHFSFACEQLACSFNGSGSTDSDGSIENYAWDFGDGDAAAGTAADHEFSGAGSYPVTLTVRDDEGATDTYSKNVEVELPNIKPDAEFSIQCQDNACDVDGVRSSDPDGYIVSWNWKFGDGGTGDGVQTAHPYAAAGTYTIVLTVKDGDGASDSQSRTITVNMPNQAPAAAFTSECTGERCTFDARDSSDSDGQIVAWHWSFGDGHGASGSQVEHAYGQDGQFNVTLTVEDDAGASATTWSYVKVALPVAGPVAEFSVDCEDLSCTLDAGSGTHDAGSLASYDWAFGDGATGQGRMVSHEYTEDGVYRVTLKVTNGGTLSDTITRTIEVVAARPIELEGTGGRLNARSVAVLRWSQASTQTVIVRRDGRQIAEVANTGKYIDTDTKGVRKTARYQVCDSLGGHCSREFVVLFGPAWGDQYPEGKTPPGKGKN